jgi:hypothetical protein
MGPPRGSTVISSYRKVKSPSFADGISKHGRNQTCCSHSHPGRAVWQIFEVSLAEMLRGPRYWQMLSPRVQKTPQKRNTHSRNLILGSKSNYLRQTKGGNSFNSSTQTWILAWCGFSAVLMLQYWHQEARGETDSPKRYQRSTADLLATIRSQVTCAPSKAR